MAGTYVCYLSAHGDLGQNPSKILDLFAQFPERQFHVYLKTPIVAKAANVQTYPHGDPSFTQNLLAAEGLICSAGHSLPSEAAYLGVPMLATPLPTYEQHMNATMVAQQGFGLMTDKITPQKLAEFFAFAGTFVPPKTHNTRVAEVCALMGLV